MRRIIAAQKIREKRNTRKKDHLWGINLKTFIMLSVLGLGVSFYLILWVSGFWEKGIKASEAYCIHISTKMGFVVEDILLEGRQRIQKQSVSEALDIKPGDPILKFNPWEAKARLEEFPWIRASFVERRLPNLIYVRLSERHPMARWRHKKKMDLIDDQGVVIPLKDGIFNEKGELLDQEFSSLPLFIGEKAQEKAADFLHQLQGFPTILKHVTASSFVGERRWNIYIDKTIEVRLPELEIEKALEVLRRLDKQDLLFARDIKMIDLRFLPKIIIRPQKNILTQQKGTKASQSTILNASQINSKAKDV